MKFQVGDQVVEKSRLLPHTNWLVYKIVGILDGNYLMEFYADGFGQEVEVYEEKEEISPPGSRGWREGIQRVPEEGLLSVEEAKQELLRLEAEKDKLEKEFTELRKKIKARMDQASALVKEAQDIAESVGKDLYDAPQECRPLFKVLNDAGWSASSMRC